MPHSMGAPWSKKSLGGKSLTRGGPSVPLRLLLPWRTASLLPGHPRLVFPLHGQCCRPCHAPGTVPDPWGSWLCQRREATEPQLQWKQGEVQLIPLQGLGTVRLTLSWTPPLLPYDSFLTPFTPWPAGQPSLLKLFAAGGRTRLGLELMLTWRRTCKGSQPGRALPHPQAI